MTIIQGIQQSPLHHDYKQTKTLPVIMMHSFQTSVTDVRCWKWFMETSQIITVSGQTHSCPYHNYIYIYYTLLVYYSSTRKKTKFSLPCLACTNLTCTLLLCCALKRLLLLLRTGQTKSHPTLTVWPIADFLPVLYICCCCWSLLYADLNQYNIRNYQLMRTLTTLCTIIMPAHQ